MSHLQTLFATKQAELMPKKKFTFTTRKKERDTSDDSSLPVEDKHSEISGPLLISSASAQCGFSNKQDEKLSMNVRYIRIEYVLLHMNTSAYQVSIIVALSIRIYNTSMGVVTAMYVVYVINIAQ